MRLHTLLRELSELHFGGLPDLEIKALTADSRQVTPGAIFIAIKGTVTDGHLFLNEAVSKGATVLIGESPDPTLGAPYLQVADSKTALAQLAAAWNGNPSRKLIMIGVTGTDGKTTTVNLIYRILLRMGLKTGMITTVNAVVGDQKLDTGLHVTTPDAIAVQSYLAEMVSAGMTHCVLEATSHGLGQRRVAACNFDLGVVTNITHEHLDYHGSYEAYRQAKGLLFEWLNDEVMKKNGPPKAAILNHDDSSYAYLRGIAPRRQITYGRNEGVDVIAKNIRSGKDGVQFEVTGPEVMANIRTPLIGTYNVENCLAAFAATVYGLEVPSSIAVEGIAALDAVPGRMEIIDLGQEFIAMVDFAHTPNALRRALETARRLTQGKVIAAFGSAGLRDREKRRLMAEISLELADLTILTAEDPRTESLDVILEEMANGALGRGGVEGKNFVRIPDRGEALRFAVQQAGVGDVVISCGKGHEQSMCFGEIEYPWDDRTAMRAALAEHLGIDGPDMLKLPTST